MYFTYQTEEPAKGIGLTKEPKFISYPQPFLIVTAF